MSRGALLSIVVDDDASVERVRDALYATGAVDIDSRVSKLPASSKRWWSARTRHQNGDPPRKTKALLRARDGFNIN